MKSKEANFRMSKNCNIVFYVILNEVKNLTNSMCYKLEILRPAFGETQNDIS